jgi:hypothetical protein
MQMTSVFKQQQFWRKEIGDKHFRTRNESSTATAAMSRSFIIKVNTSTLMDFCP